MVSNFNSSHLQIYNFIFAQSFDQKYTDKALQFFNITTELYIKSQYFHSSNCFSVTKKNDSTEHSISKKVLFYAHRFITRGY